MMRSFTILALVSVAATLSATPYTGNDAASNAMGNTGVASAAPQDAFQFNPGLLADYPDNDDFGLTLPSVKFFIDDTAGFINSSSVFLEEGGTWEKFQKIDSNALESAVNAVPTTLTAITTDITNIENAVTSIEIANSQPALNTAVADLNTASASLTTNSATLDGEVSTVNAQLANLTDTVSTAQEDLESFSDKPLQIGLGIDLLSIAIPSQTLAMGLSLSTTSSFGTSFSIATADLDPIVDMSQGLTDYSAQAQALTAAVNALAAANQSLTEHFQDVPQYSDDPNSEYAAWETELGVREAAVVAAQAEVTTEQTALETFTATNGTIVNGAIVAPNVDDPQSDIEIVGANMSELGITLAKQFVVFEETVAVGITPKLQSINVFEKTISLANGGDELDEASESPSDYFLDNTTQLYRFNLDVGAAKTWDFYGRVKAGVALKDMIPWTLESDQGTELLIRPKLRIGTAHETNFTKVTLDFDVTENKPLKYGVPTRYLGVGTELNAFGWAAIRAGYRNNLSVADSHVVSGGLALTPFGTGLQLSAWAKPVSDPEIVIQDIGFVAQFSVNL